MVETISPCFAGDTQDSLWQSMSKPVLEVFREQLITLTIRNFI